MKKKKIALQPSINRRVRLLEGEWDWDWHTYLPRDSGRRVSLSRPSKQGTYPN